MVKKSILGNLPFDIPVILLLPIRLDDPDCLMLNEEDIVRLSGICLVLSHRHTRPRRQVEPGVILHDPPALGQEMVDVVAGALFGGLVRGGGHLCIMDMVFRDQVNVMDRN